MTKSMKEFLIMHNVIIILGYYLRTFNDFMLLLLLVYRLKNFLCLRQISQKLESTEQIQECIAELGDKVSWILKSIEGEAEDDDSEGEASASHQDA